jgi:hypothetical protein
VSERQFIPLIVCALALVVSSNGNRLFVWPTYNTFAYERADDMARHGDPEAQRYVNGESDINPFGAW